MSGFAAERQAIEARLAANFTAIPIRYGNAPFKELATAWAACHILRGEGNQISLGAGAQLQRWVGLIVVQIFVPLDSGTQQAASYADSVAAIFNRAEFSAGASGLIRCRVTRIDTIGDRNGWFQLNVTTPYIRDKSV